MLLRTASSPLTLTCGSIEAKVLQGSVELETPDAAVTVALVSGGQAELDDSGAVVVALAQHQPVDVNGVWNTMKGGSTVPVKFELFYGATELTDPSAVVTTITQVGCPTSSAATDTIEELTTELPGLRYTGDNFHLNWKSPKKPGTCWKITVTEGNARLTANFRLS